MNKQEFLGRLRAELSGLPSEDLEERLAFLSEMIDDRMEEGLSEEEAVRCLGSLDKVVSQILADVPFAKIVKERIKPKKRLSALNVVLLSVGSPIWIALGAVLLAIVVLLYAVLWSLVASAWAVFASLAACAPAGIAGGVIFICQGFVPSGLLLIGGALACAGVAIFCFVGCLMATKGGAWMSRQIVLWIKACFVRRRDEK